ncbi:MAG TPA: hypothetical protein VHA52_10250 [Candidatus Babeliaceae bacterium]|nr:hypothetical protein [Candidatus Babeliaceae bacterium]
MESLSLLEQKISALICSKKQDNETIRELREQVALCTDENHRLVEENLQLKAEIEQMKNTLLMGHQNVETLSEERELTKAALDNLIESISFLVEQEQNHEQRS